MENPLVTKKLRKTKARNLIISILSQDKDKAFSVEELHEACGADLQIDLSTVYRTMHTLAESGFVTKSMHPNGKAYFQIASQQGTEHHHRIVCSKSDLIRNGLYHDITQYRTYRPLSHLQSRRGSTGFTDKSSITYFNSKKRQP